MKDSKTYICTAIVIFSAFAFILTGCGGGGGGGGGDGHTISGTVTLDGVGLSGVTMTLAYSNWLSGSYYAKTTTTDSNGNYEFHVDTGYCSIRPSKYSFKFVAWSSGLNLVDSDLSGVNFAPTSCLAECPVVRLGTPENNFIITKSSYIYGIWDNTLQAVILSGSAEIDNCGGASLVDWNYVIDGHSLDQTYKDDLMRTFLCWDGDHPQNCEPMQPVPVNDNPILFNSDYVSVGTGWRFPSTGSHTWSVQATNLYSGCTASSEIRTLIIEP
jgi:hypothetical protein